MKDLVERLKTTCCHCDTTVERDTAEASTEISRLRALNAELMEALEACPLPSTMGNVKTHYDQFYDWYNKHVDPALTRAKGEATVTQIASEFFARQEPLGEDFAAALTDIEKDYEA